MFFHRDHHVPCVIVAFLQSVKLARIATASTIIPIPPNHCNKDLQISTPSVKFSKLGITVDPVVVIPLIASKKASVKC